MTVGTFAVAALIKLAPSAGRIGGAAIRKAGEWGLTAVRRVLRDIVALGYRARQAAPSVRKAAPSIPSAVPDRLFEFFSDAVQDYVEEEIGLNELKSELADPFVSRVEGHLRGWFEYRTAARLDELHGPLTATDLEGGPAGDQVAARGAFATALSGMEFRARRAHELTGTFNEGLAPILGQLQGTLQEIYPLADDPNVREIMQLTKQSFDLFMTFMTGGAVSMLIGGAAVQTIEDVRFVGIQMLNDGRDIEGSL